MSRENTQMIIDIVFEGFAKQDWRQSINVLGSCLYRGPNNTRCAVGMLINDDLYNVRMENHGCGHELVLPAIQNSLDKLLDEDDIHFIQWMQQTHDRSSDARGMVGDRHKTMKEEMIQLVVKNGYNIPNDTV